VERGELVRVSVKTGSAEVVAVGEARTNGRLGDLVEVKNVDTGKRFYGRVVSAGVVEVDLSG
jgi:flagella basal body P-ring formation protein FlgA